MDTEQKTKYDQNREQERKRRFNILSGNFKPITTNIHLQSGEHAYFECPAQRMADQEHIQSYTTGKARSPFLQGGLLRGNTKINTSTTHQRITKTEVIDHGNMLFTNKRIVFIGKAVVSLSYSDILSVEFFNSLMVVKYPQMLTNEGYELDKDAKFYYQGLMHFLGRYKSKVIEADVDMSDYPMYVSEEEKQKKQKQSFKKNVLIFIGIAVFIAIFLRGVSMILTELMASTFVISGIGYPLFYLYNRVNDEHAELLPRIKLMFFWSIPLTIFCFILSVITYH